jgi:hypothetical protein
MLYLHSLDSNVFHYIQLTQYWFELWERDRGHTLYYRRRRVICISVHCFSRATSPKREDRFASCSRVTVVPSSYYPIVHPAMFLQAALQVFTSYFLLMLTTCICRISTYCRHFPCPPDLDLPRQSAGHRPPNKCAIRIWAIGVLLTGSLSGRVTLPLYCLSALQSTASYYAARLSFGTGFQQQHLWMFSTQTKKHIGS